MYRTPHDDRDDMKVWLAADEVDDYLALVEDTPHRIALALGLRCGLRSAEIVKATPADLADGPTGTMLRVPDGKGGKYRETPVPPELKTIHSDRRRRPSRAVQRPARRRQHPDAPSVGSEVRRPSSRGVRRRRLARPLDARFQAHLGEVTRRRRGRRPAARLSVGGLGGPGDVP